MKNRATSFANIKQIALVLSVLIGILFLLPATSAMAGIMNAGFAEDSEGIIDGWTYSENGLVTSSGGGSVQFNPDYQRTINDAFLRQVFTLDPGSTTLSFDGVIGVKSETGIFTAALLNPVTHASLVTPLEEGTNYFFYIITHEIPAGSDHLDFTCSLDVSGLSGEVELVFNLNNDYPLPVPPDEVPPDDSYATLSNLTVVPEPATMALLGLGGFLFARKKK